MLYSTRVRASKVSSRIRQTKVKYLFGGKSLAMLKVLRREDGGEEHVDTLGIENGAGSHFGDRNGTVVGAILIVLGFMGRSVDQEGQSRRQGWGEGKGAYPYISDRSSVKLIKLQQCSKAFKSTGLLSVAI